MSRAEEELPGWPGAAEAYAQGEAWMEASQEEARAAGVKWTAPEDVLEMIAAMNQGDEVMVKWLNILHYRRFFSAA